VKWRNGGVVEWLSSVTRQLEFSEAEYREQGLEGVDEFEQLRIKFANLRIHESTNWQSYTLR
jgi:hypothetical protein